ncbi:glutaminase [Paracoccus tibetensis]|uniref:glutaminase n=1 Tax=Paracoccus tibetensis TaxID=336292 RepID=A0A1G5I4S4_9RHOB|nr:Glutaminase [Paracoccus tibetensis]
MWSDHFLGPAISAIVDRCLEETISRSETENEHAVQLFQLICVVAFRVGIPGKSGFGGGVLTVVPGQASIAIWTPGLHNCRNPLAATLIAEKLSRFTAWSVFGQSADLNASGAPVSSV